MMKTSKYNYTVKLDDKVWFVNGITEAMFPISDKNYRDIMTIIENPNDNLHFGSFLEKLKINGYIIEDTTDEYELIKEKYRNLRRPNVFTMMILPTYQCNLRCWYCIQEHQESWMSEHTVQSILTRISQITAKPEYKTFNISWFGGEPILAYDILRRITEFAQNECKRNGKNFNCDITTNSTLLNSERIIELRKLGITSYQITLDGKQETHDRIKVLKGKSAFETTLRNINEISKHTRCTVRFNYTSKTIQEASELLNQLDLNIEKNSRRNIRISICRIWQEEEDNINHVTLDKIIRNAFKLGFEASVPLLGMCYADEFNFECIMPNGKVGKCDNDPALSMPGRITSTGKIQWSDEIKTYHPTFIENHEHICHKCTYLPICWSACPQSRATMNKNGGQIRCKFKNRDKDVIELLRKRIFISTQLRNNLNISANGKQKSHSQ